MRRRLVILFVVAILLLATNAVYSETYDIVDNYYSDNTYSTAVGWDERYCGSSPTDPLDSDGTMTIWRDRNFKGCATGTTTTWCQQWDGSTWQDVQCPSTYSLGGRLRVPTG